MNVDQQQLAKQIIRERSTPRYTTRRPQHPRTAKMLRRLAHRMDSAGPEQ